MIPERECGMAEETEKQGGLFRNRERLLKVMVAAGLLGIALIFLSSVFSKQNEKKDEEVNTLDPQMMESANLYREQLTEELGNMVASIEGAGKTKLMITLEGTVRSIYATDSDIQSNDKNTEDQHQNNEKRTCIVVRRQDGSEQALTISQTMPGIRGVLVVCEGGDRQEVAEAIRSAVAAAVHLAPSRICVLKMSV